MKIDILTLFPEMFSPLKESIIKRAVEDGKIEINITNIRDYANPPHYRCDDMPFGGGAGMVMMCEPLFKAIESVKQENSKIFYMSPRGRVFNQSLAREMSRLEHIVLLCGHYEGIDQRFIDECVDEEISLGDFVLTGGEIAAMAVTDAVCRMVPGVLADPECFEDESHFNGMLEYPQYSRPAVWHGKEVPQILLSGNHEKVAQWRRKQSIRRTRDRRPDMYAQLDLTSKKDKRLLREIEDEDNE